MALGSQRTENDGADCDPDLRVLLSFVSQHTLLLVQRRRECGRGQGDVSEKPMMWAAVADRYGGPEVLEYRRVPRPAPAADEVLVHQEFVGLCFGDLAVLLGRFAAPHTYGTTLPLIPGSEGAGRVAAVGDSVQDFRVGDRVTYSMHERSYAQFSVVPEWMLVPVPDDVDLRVAVNFVGNGLTAYYLAHKLFPQTTYYEAHPVEPLNPGDTVLVLAAAGSVGIILTQLAMQRGARVIALVGNAAKAAIVRALGVEDVILYRETDYVAEVRRMTAGRGVDIAYDSVGKDTYLKSMQCLRRRGICVLYGAASGVPDLIRPMQDLAENGSIFATRTHCLHHYPDQQAIRDAMNDLYGRYRSGVLEVRLEPEDFPLSEAAAALALVKTGTLTGRLFLRIGHD